MKLGIFSNKKVKRGAGLVASVFLTAGVVSFVPLSTATADTGDGSLTVTVTRDVNANGLYDSVLEPPMVGVSVRITDAAGASQTYVTDALGEVSLPANDLTFVGGKYRVEVINPDPAIYSPAAAQTDPPVPNQLKSSVNFVDLSGGNDVSVRTGFASSGDYCQSNPRIVSACQQGFRVNIPVGSPSYYVDDERGLYTGNYKGGDEAGLATLTDYLDTGVVYGIGWKAGSNEIFSAATAKRGAEYGPAGPGGIYVTDRTTGVTSTWTTVPNAGSSTHNPDLNQAGDLEDFAFRSHVAKESLGDLDVTKDGKHLLVITLNDRNLYLYNANNANLIGNYSIPNTCATASDWRPYALGENSSNGLIYVGGVCSGESGDPLSAEVVTFDVDTQTFGAQVMNDQLGFMREPGSGGACNNTSWKPWGDDIPLSCVNGAGFFNAIHYPTPMLADLDFTVTGEMLVSFRDRTGDQYPNRGWTGYSDFFGPKRPWVVPAGDLLKAFDNGSGTFVLDENGGGGLGHEFFEDDVPVVTVDESLFAGLAYTPSEPRVVTNKVDPEFASWHIGYTSLDVATGAKSIPEDVIVIGDNFTPPNQEDFGKSQGLADIEVLCDLAPIQIGNRVWLEANTANGIQDPDEGGIPNVIVKLLDAGGNEIASTTTDSNGEYLFSQTTWPAIQPNTQYTVSLPYVDNNGLGDPLEGFCPTDYHSGVNPELDSDGQEIANGDVQASVTTGEAGENNHSIDFGYRPCGGGGVGVDYDLAIRKALLSPVSGEVEPGDTVTWQIQVFNQGDQGAWNIRLEDYLPTGLTGVTGDGNLWTDQGSGVFARTLGYLAAGDATPPIFFQTTVGDDASGVLTNNVKIARAEETLFGDPIADADSDYSTPIGDYDVVDNEINEAPPTDDDSHDIAQVRAHRYDVAIRKRLVGDPLVPVNNGDILTFEIEVFNQGTEPVQNVHVRDRLPAGLVITDANWTAIGPSEYERVLPGVISAGGTSIFNIKATVTGAPAGSTLTNHVKVSEISSEKGDVVNDSDSNYTVDYDAYPLVDDAINSKLPVDEDSHDVASVVTQKATDPGPSPSPNPTPTPNPNPTGNKGDNANKPRNPNHLPNTGAEVMAWMIPAGAAVVILGSGLVVASRRRKGIE